MTERADQREIDEIDGMLAVTRLEVIGEQGRLLTLRPVEVEMVQFQDDGRTVKLFVKTSVAVQPPPPVGSPTTAWIPTDGCDCRLCDMARESAPVEPAGASAPLSGLARFDLVSVSFAYTSDHEMERADDGEWVRFDDVFPPASLSTVEPTVHNDLCSWCLTQADHVAASEECYERNSERGRIDSKPPVAPEPPTDPACKRCGHTLSAHRPEFGACDGSTRPCACPEFVQTTGAPAPCVWRPKESGYESRQFDTACGGEVWLRMYQQFNFCPFCGHPLTVER